MLRTVLAALLFAVSLYAAAQDMITGQVSDASTGDSIPFAGVRYSGRKGGIACDRSGHFSIERRTGWLIFTAVGYKPLRVRTDGSAPAFMRVVMQPDCRQLDEVTVKTGRRRYRRKDNPAVELMRRVIAAKKRTGLDNRPFYEYYNYRKITLAVNDINPGDLDKGVFRRAGWLTAQVEFCPLNKKLIMPMAVDETVTRNIYRREPRGGKSIVMGHRAEGVNQVLQTGGMLNALLQDAFTDVDIYDDQIRLLRHPFTSPIGKDAIGFYRFYIVDTVSVGGDRCCHLEFMPNNPQDFGFRGELYVLADSTLHVRQCILSLPKSSDVNFVDNLWIRQEYTRLPGGGWALTTDDMCAEMSLADFLTKVLVTRTTRKSGYSFEPLPKSLFRGKTATVTHPDALMRKDGFWDRYRAAPLTRGERSIGQFVRKMQQSHGYKYAIIAFRTLVENFVETGGVRHPSKVDIGPVNTIVSRNFIDGVRTRASLQTTANLFPRLFLKGYYARGWESRKDYYRAALMYSLVRKQYTYDEFPRRGITFESTYDVFGPSDKFMHTDKDNVFTSFKWAKADKMMFANRQTIKFEYETDYSLSASVTLKAEKTEACGALRFVTLDRDRAAGQPVGSGLHNGSMRTADVCLSLRYAPGEKYMNTKLHRVLVNHDAPVFTLSHTVGLKGFLGGEYGYHLTEAGVYKRFWLNSWGKLEVNVRGGLQWSRVPFPLLVMPAANLSYIASDDAFSMINNMEFLNDRYASLSLSWDMKGKLFNRVPLLRRLKWREYLSFRTLWGALSDKNNPELERNGGSRLLMYMPEGSHVMDSGEPYMECAVGVHNIFKILHVQYVRRLNYTGLPSAGKHGVRFMFNFSF